MLHVGGAIWWGYALVVVMHQLSLCISCRYASVVVMHQLSDYVNPLRGNHPDTTLMANF